MSASIGAIGQYQIAMQQMQLSMIKNNIDMQKQVIDVLLNPENRAVPTSENLGQNIDISI